MEIILTNQNRHKRIEAFSAHCYKNSYWSALCPMSSYASLYHSDFRQYSAMDKKNPNCFIYFDFLLLNFQRMHRTLNGYKVWIMLNAWNTIFVDKFSVVHHFHFLWIFCDSILKDVNDRIVCYCV